MVAGYHLEFPAVNLVQGYFSLVYDEGFDFIQG